MQVSKWGNSLAIRLPAAVVEVLGLKEGDDVEVTVAGEHQLEVGRAPDDERPAVRSPLTNIGQFGAQRAGQYL